MNKELIRKFITRADPTIVEIGAHHGEDSAHFRMMYPEARLYLFEPDPHCIQLIKDKNLKAHLFEGVVSDVDGEVDFYRSGEDDNTCDGSGSILIPHLHKELFPAVHFSPAIKVKSIMLDTFVKQEGIEFIDFLWMDVQGAEGNVILGGMQTFKYKVRAVFTEYCNEPLYLDSLRQSEILQLLPEYAIVKDYEGGTCGDMLLQNEGL